MRIFIYPKCSTCKKAVNYLKERNIKFESRDIVLERPTIFELEEFIKISGKDINKFFNTSGIKYREMGLKDKLAKMSDKEKIELLASDGMLVKRPMLIGEDFVLNGFREKEWQERFDNWFLFNYGLLK